MSEDKDNLEKSMAALADERVSIPLEASVESLNVAIAAALLVYEAYRQRSTRIK